LPQDHKVIGFTADGSCALLADGECSIYSSRPQTCRDYDCRVFAAAGIDAGGSDKAAINHRVRQWRFSYASERDVQSHNAVKAAASFIEKNRASFPGGRAPVATSDIAVLAIKVRAIFLGPDATSTPAEKAKEIVLASRAFEALRKNAS